PAGAERRRQARGERRVIIDPVQRGVREDEVPGRARREGADVARLEAEPALRARPRLGEHRLGAVDAERLARRELVVETRGQLARTAPEIHHPHARARADERQQVEERPRALVVEAPVLCGIPEVARHAGRISYPPPRSSTNAAGDAIERGACHLARGMPPESGFICSGSSRRMARSTGRRPSPGAACSSGTAAALSGCCTPTRARSSTSLPSATGTRCHRGTSGAASGKPPPSTPPATSFSSRRAIRRTGIPPAASRYHPTRREIIRIRSSPSTRPPAARSGPIRPSPATWRTWTSGGPG